MPRGYRRIIVAAFGIALIGATPQPAGSDLGNQSAAQREITSKLDRIAAALEKAPSIPTPDAGCELGQDDRQSDLCAQWKAADAAGEAAAWAGATFWLGVTGIVIGAGTLIAAALAAKFAKDAARHTADSVIEAKRAAQAAEDALGESRAAMAQQLRPYVQFMDRGSYDGAKFERGTKEPYAFKNFGQTPAKSVEISWGFDIVRRPIGNRISQFGISQCIGDLAPGQLVEDNITIDLSPASIARIAGGEVLMLRMRLSYTWGTGESDCHDLSYSLCRDGPAPWKFVLLNDSDRQRTE